MFDSTQKYMRTPPNQLNYLHTYLSELFSDVRNSTSRFRSSQSRSTRRNRFSASFFSPERTSYLRPTEFVNSFPLFSPFATTYRSFHWATSSSRLLFAVANSISLRRSRSLVSSSRIAASRKRSSSLSSRAAFSSSAFISL